jgi:hypothetical protein
MTAHTRMTYAADAAEITDEDRDSLHTLSIGILPLQSPIFRRARLVKNSRLESVIEFFSGAGCGRGQLAINNVAQFMGLEKAASHPDITLLKTISVLPSFDVYSLRIQLRASDISIADTQALTLSPAKIEALSAYMAKFTRPLIAEIFGRDTTGEKFQDIVGLFRADNAKEVLERLDMMANRLGIPIESIPKFLEDYGDIFMSLSYYRQCLDQLLPQVQHFMDGIALIRASHQMAQDQSLKTVINFIEATINGRLANISGKIESFERSTNDLWRDLNVDKFKRIEALVSSYHTSIGGALCALSVKMSAWADQFPHDSGSIGRRVAFLMSDIRQGIELIQGDDNDAPMLASLN